MCKCMASDIKPWRFVTKTSRVWQSPPLWKTMGCLLVSSQTRSHADPPVLWDTGSTPSRWLLCTTWLVTLPIVWMQSHWPVVNHTLIQMHPNNILIWTYFNCLGKNWLHQDTGECLLTYKAACHFVYLSGIRQFTFLCNIMQLHTGLFV